MPIVHNEGVPYLDLVHTSAVPAIRIRTDNGAHAIEITGNDGLPAWYIDSDGNLSSGGGGGPGTATISELVAGAALLLNQATAATVPVFVAPFACNIAAANIAPGAAVAASDTNYWTVKVQRYRAGVSADIATKTTQVTGGAAMALLQDWNFDAVTFSATNQVCAKGDVIVAAFTPTGTPANIVNPLTQIRYEPT